jgi:cellulose 1,4-beta-cellobiosidase
VEQSTTTGGPYTTVQTGVTDTNYTDVGLTDGTTYYYVVNAVGSNGESDPSAEVMSTPAAPVPAPPTGLTAAPGDGQVSLSWTASAGADSYVVMRSATTGGPYPTVQTGVTGTTWTDTGLTDGSTYYYVVAALSAGGESGNSNEAATTPVAAPAPPGTPTDLTATPGDTEIGLSWTASAGSGAYSVERSTTSGGPYTTIHTGVTGTTWTDTGLTDGTTYYYVLTAVNTSGGSAPSAEASATPSVVPPAPTNVVVVVNLRMY